MLSGIPWETYAALRDAADAGGSRRVRMTYLEGALELMSPLPEHEDAKTTLARLIELWSIERDVPLYGYGETTFRNAAKSAGLEPDECYCVRRKLGKGVPDLAIEVVLTHGGIEKLLVYAKLGVREVWFWEDDALHLHALRGDAYEAITASEVLPDLDVDALARFTRIPDQHQAVLAFRDHLRDKR
jgi:Uma2 family endonuclease